jgi:protein CpxP
MVAEVIGGKSDSIDGKELAMHSLLRKFVLQIGLAALLAPVTLFAFGAPGDRPGMGFPNLEAVKGKLNLTSAQQVQWDAAATQSKIAFAAIRQNRQQLRQAMKAELAKPDPDLAAVAALSDRLQPVNIAARQQARNEWLKLYATFSPDQKAVVKDAIQTRTQRMKMFRQHMRERLPPNG